MPENNPTLSTFTAKKKEEPTNDRRRLLEVNKGASERAKQKLLEKETDKPVESQPQPELRSFKQNSLGEKLLDQGK